MNMAVELAPPTLSHYSYFLFHEAVSYQSFYSRGTISKNPIKEKKTIPRRGPQGGGWAPALKGKFSDRLAVKRVKHL